MGRSATDIKTPKKAKYLSGIIDNGLKITIICLIVNALYEIMDLWILELKYKVPLLAQVCSKGLGGRVLVPVQAQVLRCNGLRCLLAPG